MKGTEIRKILKENGIKDFAKVRVWTSWNNNTITTITVSETVDENEIRKLFPNENIWFDYFDYRWFDGSLEYKYEYGKKILCD